MITTTAMALLPFEAAAMTKGALPADARNRMDDNGCCDAVDTLSSSDPLQRALTRQGAVGEADGRGEAALLWVAQDDDASCSSSSCTCDSASPSSSPPGDPSGPPGTSPSLDSQVAELCDRRSKGKKDLKKCHYRSQLEREVQALQEQLQEEIDLHVALTNVVGQNTSTLLSSPCKLPEKAQVLLANIITLEITVSKLEEELASLHFSLTQERSERYLAEYHLGHFPSLSLMPTCHSSDNSWEENISSLRGSKGIEIPHSLELDNVDGNGQLRSMTVNSPSDLCSRQKISQSCTAEHEVMEIDLHLKQVDPIDSFNENFLIRNLWHHPNHLSEEMVRCMRNIFLSLSESSNVSSKLSSSECFPSTCTCSPVGHLSNSSLTSFSDSSVIPPPVCSPRTDMHPCHEIPAKESFLDPYGVNGKVTWPNIGSYSTAAEVSWMVVGKKQLEYAAEALRIFRFLVEQLAKVSPAKMNGNQKLAFWINLYNALIMHAYLAYGIPKSDIKLFSLMQKVSYTVGGLSISAADIEFVILKMKPPTYRPQIALILALHKFKISEEHKKFSIDNPEPLAVFATSCGMYSSPAVRIFTAGKVKEELQSAFKDYVRASVGISDKGKLLVPKLLHCFAKGVVEDSLLVDWICRFLSAEQAGEVRNSTSHRKQRLLGARSFCIVPFDSRFRYLFLPDNKSSRRFF